MPCHTFFSKAQPVAKACRYLFAKGSVTGCLFWKRMSFFQRLYHISFFSNAVGCILPAIKGYIAHPFVFQMFVFFHRQFATTFFSKAAGNLFCKGCRQPFLQRLWPTFPTSATFFPKVLFWLESPPILFSKGAFFSKGCHFCTSFNLLLAWPVWTLIPKLLLWCCLVQWLSWAFQSHPYNLWSTLLGPPQSTSFGCCLSGTLWYNFFLGR